jgi:ankyrin repeat protein
MANFYGISARSRVDALCRAAANSRVPIIKKLLADGVDINGIDVAGNTAIHVTARVGCVNAAKLLLATNPKLDVLDRHDLTPLMVACHYGLTKSSRVALLLIAAGANVNYCREGDGMTPLMFAVRRSTPAVLQSLIDHGAQVDGPRNCPQTPLMLAARADNVPALRVLAENGADLARKCKLRWAEGLTAEGLASLEHRKKAIKFLQGL